MITVFDYPEQREQFEAFIAANPQHRIWHDGAVMRVYTGDDLPVEPAVNSVTPRQIRLALNQTGLRSTVEQAVAGGSQDLKDWWEYALDIERDNALVVGMAAQLGITEQQLDDLFRLAATL